MKAEEFTAQFNEQAEKQVKMRLALEAVAAKEKIEATEDEVEAELNKIADTYKMELDKVKAVIDTAAVKADLAVNKAIDFIKEKAEITAEAPKAEILTYATALRSMTQGRGRFSESFARYEQAPDYVVQNIVK